MEKIEKILVVTSRADVVNPDALVKDIQRTQRVVDVSQNMDELD